MFYIVAFVIGGCARSPARAGLFAGLYVALYAAFLFANSAAALRNGTASVGYVLQHLVFYAAIAFAVTGVGHLGRIFVGERLEGERLERSADREGVASTAD